MGTTALGQRIATLRQRAGFGSQAALARALGVNRSTISLLESGVTTDPSSQTLQALADALGVGVGYLLTGEGGQARAASQAAPGSVDGDGLVAGDVVDRLAFEVDIPSLSILRGDVAEVDRTAVPVEGSIAVVRWPDGSHRVVTLHFVDGMLFMRRVDYDDLVLHTGRHERVGLIDQLTRYPPIG